MSKISLASQIIFSFKNIERKVEPEIVIYKKVPASWAHPSKGWPGSTQGVRSDPEVILTLTFVDWA